MRILLVDDSRVIAAVFGARLRELGYQVDTASNGVEAVELFKESAPDLVLMDIEMPVMNGFEAAQKIRAVEATQSWAWTPIIFLTASETAENLVTAIEAGGDDFISKAAPEAVLQAKMKAMRRIAQLRSALSQANRQLEMQANMDGLTGLYNRRHMDRYLDAQWQEAIAAGSSFGLLMIDVDNFKKYNDHYGHLSGDDCLREVARGLLSVTEKAMEERLLSHSFVARYGCEEFAVLLPQCSAEAYEELAQRVVTGVAALGVEHRYNENWGVVTLSVGGAFVQPAEGKLSPVFRHADANLYRAKAGGRNRVELG